MAPPTANKEVQQLQPSSIPLPHPALNAIANSRNAVHDFTNDAIIETIVQNYMYDAIDASLSQCLVWDASGSVLKFSSGISSRIGLLGRYLLDHLLGDKCQYSDTTKMLKSMREYYDEKLVPRTAKAHFKWLI